MMTTNPLPNQHHKVSNSYTKCLHHLLKHDDLINYVLCDVLKVNPPRIWIWVIVIKYVSTAMLFFGILSELKVTLQTEGLNIVDVVKVIEYDYH